MGILRLSHVEIRVPDLELATAYYSEVVGLLETAREPERVFMKCWDEHQHHSVVLVYAPTHGLNSFGFKVTDAADLDHYARRLQAAGVEVQRLEKGEWGPGHGQAIRFDLPSGHRMELVHGMEQVGNLLPRTNPPPRPMNLTGIAPPRAQAAGRPLLPPPHAVFLPILSSPHPNRGRRRISARTCRKFSTAGSATTGPGAIATITRSASGPKSARKCTELFSAMIGQDAGSIPTCRKIA